MKIIDKRTIRKFEKTGRERRNLIIERMTELGHKAIVYAYRNSYMSTTSPITGKTVWKNVSGNLHDSYGSAVYVDGVLQPDSIRFVDNNTLGGSNNRDSRENRGGREVLIDYLHSIHPRQGQNDVTIVCVAAMYYAQYLESGAFSWKSKSGIRYKIKVISLARKYIDQNYHKYIDDVYVRFKIPKPKARVVKGTKYDDKG